MTDQRVKDPMITFKATKRGKNTKGGDRLTLYLTPEMAQFLIDNVAAGIVGGTGRGVTLDIHTSEKQYEGRTFDSTIAFAKATAEPPGGAARAAGPRTYAPVASSATAAAAASLKAAQVK